MKRNYVGTNDSDDKIWYVKAVSYSSRNSVSTIVTEVPASSVI